MFGSGSGCHDDRGVASTRTRPLQDIQIVICSEPARPWSEIETNIQPV